MTGYRPLLAEPNSPDYTEAELTAAREHLADDVLTGGTKPSLADVLSENDHEELGPVLMLLINSNGAEAIASARYMVRDSLEHIVAAHFAHPDQEDAVRLRALELREAEVTVRHDGGRTSMDAEGCGACLGKGSLR